MTIMIPTCLDCTSTLKTLSIGMNPHFTDDVMLSFADALVNNSTLEELNLESCFSVTAVGWLALSRELGSSSSSLKILNLDWTSIDDQAITAFANDLSRNKTLEELSLHSVESVTTTGWLAFSRLLGSPHSALRKLYVSSNDISDTLVVAFMNELSGNENSQLKYLDLLDLDSITDAIWDSIRNVLCNASGIDATWSSNHILCDLGDTTDMPEDISDLLQMNEEEDKKSVARSKVINNHFSGDFDVNAIIGLDHKLKLLPRKISWFGRDFVGHSVVYNIIRTLLELCQNDK